MKKKLRENIKKIWKKFEILKKIYFLNGRQQKSTASYIQTGRMVCIFDQEQTVFYSVAHFVTECV